MASTLENEYVHNVYSRLATYQKNEQRGANPRIWPNVKKFVDGLDEGSVLLDIGCGEAKYHPPWVVVFGMDTCSDVIERADREGVHLLLGDAMNTPLRDNSADAVLCVSVLHHLSTNQRRRAALREAARCLRPGGRMLICVWSFEQPNASFPSQDVLVPWNLHEQHTNGRPPLVRFHMNSTKEQRIIQASIPIKVPQEQTNCTWIGNLVNKVSAVLPARIPSQATPGTVPPATSRLLPRSKGAILAGIKRWSPMLSRRLASLLVSVEEQLADEISDRIMDEALVETISALKEVTFYRFYHVFKKGELEQLVNSVAGLTVIQSSFEHANWCVVVEKTENGSNGDAFRP